MFLGLDYLFVLQTGIVSEAQALQERTWTITNPGQSASFGPWSPVSPAPICQTSSSNNDRDDDGGYDTNGDGRGDSRTYTNGSSHVGNCFNCNNNDRDSGSGIGNASSSSSGRDIGNMKSGW